MTEFKVNPALEVRTFNESTLGKQIAYRIGNSTYSELLIETVLKKALNQDPSDINCALD